MDTDTDVAEEEEEDAPGLAITANRDGVEDRLHNKPFVVPFPGQAGAPIPRNLTPKVVAHVRYAESVKLDGDARNILLSP